MAPTSMPLAEPSTAQEAIRRLQARYEHMINTQQFLPHLYPHTQFGFVLVLLYLALDHRRSPLLRRCAAPVWLYSVYSTMWVVFHTKARGSASSLGVGIVTAWFILWSATIMIFNDSQASYLRISARQRAKSPKDSSNKSSTTGIDDVIPSSNGATKRSHKTEAPTPSLPRVPAADETEEYFWQPYPASPFRARLSWVLDISSAFRGIAWNWRGTGLPPLPERITSDLNPTTSDPNAHTPARKATVTCYSTRTALLRRNAFVFIKNYLMLDLVKTLAAHDPWFWGYTSTSTPPGYLPTSFQYPTIVNICRQLICLAAMKHALELIFTLGPLFFVGILGSFPSTAGRLGIWIEPWMYPDQFGSLSIIAEKGLAGWWGGWWHQTFRKGFQTPSDAIIGALKLDKRSLAARVLGLSVAFGLSAALHACGSYTQIGVSRPWRSALFFVVQPFGIALQMGGASILQRTGIADIAPAWSKRMAMFVYTHAWLYLTAPLLLEDFARGGTFLFEPVPLSPFRGLLRLGSEEDTFLQWGRDMVVWRSGPTWRESGIAF